MGNHPFCSGAPQQCVDECARLQFESKSRDADEPECDPAGAVFSETLQGLLSIDKEALRFAGTSNLSAVRWLLSMGASTKAKDRNSTTMLHAACRSGSCLIVEELVRRSLPTDVQDSSGWTPLHIAAVMGRRDVALLLLRVRANAAVKNKKGVTPVALCRDASTREVLDEFSAAGSVLARPHPRPFLADSLAKNPGGNDDDYTSATCEPFFVPRLPLCRNEAHRAEVTYLGIDLFRTSAGHGLAFLVATGVVHDHPTDLSQFMLKESVDPVQLGKFLGEDFSLAQTLRLAYIHAVDMTSTGVVGALLKAFCHLRPPLDLGKIDRLTSAIAYLWWRTHDNQAWNENGGDGVQDSEDLDWTVFSDEFNNSAEEKRKAFEEPSGWKLRQAIRTVEGLRRLMFSTMMLCWNVHRSSKLFPGCESPRRLSLADWLDMNVGIEANGDNIPIHLQKGIYHMITDHPRKMTMTDLLPDDGDSINGVDIDDESPATSALAMQDASLAVKGWASIPRGGLERHTPGHVWSGGTRLAHSVYSEASGNQGQQMLNPINHTGQQPVQPLPVEDGETVWLTMRMSLFLFLSSGPSDFAPYAFVRLADANIREVSRQNRAVVIVGRAFDIATSSAVQTIKSRECPLRLCFLLADGRFQPFEAQQLELQFPSEDDAEIWARELGVACGSQPPQRKRSWSVTRASEGLGPSLAQVQGAPPQQPLSSEREPPVWWDNVAVPAG